MNHINTKVKNNNDILDSLISGSHFDAASLQDLLRKYEYNSEFSKCLAPLLISLHWAGHMRQLAESLPHCVEGIGLTDLRNLLVELGYASKPLRISLNEIDERLLPCLFIPEESAARVVYYKKGDSVVAFDSETQDISEMPSRQKGVAYLFDKISPTKDRALGNWFFTIIKRFKGLIVQTLLISLAVNIFFMSVPLFIMMVYDYVIASNAPSVLFQLMIGGLLALASIIALSAVQSKILVYIGGRLDHIVGKVILERLLYLPPALTESAALGAQVSRIKDFDKVREFFTSPLFSLIFELPFCILFLVFISYLGGDLVYIPIVMMGVFSVLSLVFQPFVQKNIADSTKTATQKQAFQLESLNYLDTIKYCAAESIWCKRYADVSADAAHKGFKANLLTDTTDIIANTLASVAGGAVVVMGSIAVLNGELTIGALIAIMMMIWRVIAPIKRFFSSTVKITQIKTSIKQINTLMNLVPEKLPKKTIKVLDRFNGKIEFNRVSFRYQTHMQPAVTGVSFCVQPNELVCIIGRNGSGKSTLLKLMPKLYSPQAGSIWIDNHDIRQQEPVALRHAIGYMPQEKNFFFGTIEQNLRLSNPIATTKQVIDATVQADVFKDIMTLKNGFKSKFCDGKTDLSDNFLQKLALARVYLKNAGLILLDEPGNGLSQKADIKLMRTLTTLKENATIIIVTHRPSHLQLADRILLLEQGQLVLNGRPKDVLNKISLDFM